MQEDTYLGDRSDPLSLNLYTYCANNPIRYIDPTGHVLSEADKKNLTKSQQDAIEKLTEDWKDANNAYKNATTAAEKKAAQDAMTKANDNANKIRNSAGYDGGKDGSASTPTPPKDGIKVTDVVTDAKWNDKDRTITYTNSSGQKVVLSEANKDFYCASDDKAYFYNNVGTILTAAGATVTFKDDRATGGTTTIKVTAPAQVPATTPQIITSILQRTTPLVDGVDYYLGWDNKAHFVDSSFGTAPVVPKPGGPQDSLKSKETPGSYVYETKAGLKITENTNRPLANPNDLVEIDGKLLNKGAAAALIVMRTAAYADGVNTSALKLTSGYRSDETQIPLYEAEVTKQKKLHPDWTDQQIHNEAINYANAPGASNHRTGNAADLTLTSNTGDENAHNWLVNNAEKYGFTPYKTESWHWNYDPKK